MSQNHNDTLVKIKFKGCRREFFHNTMDFPIESGDQVVVEAERGEDIGIALPFNETKTESDNDPNQLTVLRKADPRDLERDNENQLRQKVAFQFCKARIQDLNLPMKLIDVEYRLDRKKIIFYFTADDRIDFRELVKILASEYKTRIEMRQISTREETRRTGGVGLCGEPICCHQFIDNFEPISTQLVKEQNLPMNPTKISGLCGKLKCCFRYEHASYAEILKNYPAYGSKVQFRNQTGTVEKIDIFRNTVTMKFENDEMEDFPLQEFNNNYTVIDK
jgi:cell fate regulator YaaT (PSP1 superfamily)